MLGWLTAGLGTVAVGGGIGGFLATNKNGETSSTPTPDATKPAGGDATPKPETPIPTATPSPTETTTPTPEPEGARGNVAKVEDLNIPDIQKEAIHKMLEGATTQIIIQDENVGQAYVIALENSLLSKTSPYECRDTSNEIQSCGALQDVLLRKDQFSDADSRAIKGILEAKRQALIAHS